MPARSARDDLHDGLRAGSPAPEKLDERFTAGVIPPG
jgi:hypothetical protein